MKTTLKDQIYKMYASLRLDGYRLAKMELKSLNETDKLVIHELLEIQNKLIELVENEYKERFNQGIEE